ncbi:hypothetical protein QQS21_009637 [Conoideocrella luteorostrata]|uniref:F-box domain-containing protein n=1 Tax=Conoideocrella luteorostrata TaxID=1105319 RepID=A0AAJ0CGJ4_9HYPO|nr:hypothetical protein QQS21_009637 [Conoideocrella luteorostrata]
MAEIPYFLRKRSSFEQHSSFISGIRSKYPRHGTNAPPVPILIATPSTAAKEQFAILKTTSLVAIKHYYDWLRPMFKKITSNFFKFVSKVSRRKTHSSDGPELQSTISLVTSHYEVHLMVLPNEIILQIMGYLPPCSLYCLRQTSSLFMALFDLQLFKIYHKKSISFSNHAGFDLQILCASEQDAVASYLHHDMFCSSCLAAEGAGIIDTRLKALRRLQYCNGCERQHINALFFPEDGEEQDNNSGGRTCIGLHGHITLCSHRSCKPTTWQELGPHVRPFENCYVYKSACTDLSHQPEWKHNDHVYLGGTPFPRLIVSRSWDHVSLSDWNRPPIFQIGYGWDLPLLEVNYRTAPPLAVIQERLCTLVENAFHTYRPCQHITTKEIQDFAQSGICECFRKYVWFTCYDFLKGCKCGRQTTLQCRVCGAVYMWLFFADQVVFSMRYIWTVQRPTSLGWLGLINKGKLFTERNKHVLWCDAPQCRTNKKGRWETLIQEDAKREAYEILGGRSGDNEDSSESAWFDISDEGYTECWDYREMWKASQMGFLRSW